MTVGLVTLAIFAVIVIGGALWELFDHWLDD